ncbi:MAG TPA: hypothetical protein VM842_00090, partial [Nitrospira sp.]|nr:hypothetical protein [Nitrospira sp.]
MGRAHIQLRGGPQKVVSTPWVTWSDEQLLDLRMCDLRVGLPGSFYERPIAQLERELAARGLLFRPHVWISDE